jgi:hypothetical protein
MMPVHDKLSRESNDPGSSIKPGKLVREGIYNIAAGFRSKKKNLEIITNACTCKCLDISFSY